MKIAVAASKFIKGRNHPSEQTELLEVLPLRVALEREWPTDAHCVTYTLPEPATAQPRLNKPCLAHLPAETLPEVTALFLDFDLPEHGAWTGEALAAFAEKLGDEKLFAVYTTAHGARLVYGLSSPVSPDRAERLIAGLIEHWGLRGLALDRACSDWTRLFRLPKVLRDGQRTESGPFSMLDIQGHSTDPATLREADLPRTARLAVRAEDLSGRKRPDTARALVYLRELTPSGRTRETAFAKAARAALEGSELGEIVFGSKELAPAEGPGRNSAITKYAGSLVNRLIRVRGATPEALYALLLPKAEVFEPDPGQPTWEDTLWSVVTRFWSVDASIVQAEEQKAEAEKSVALAEEGFLLQKLRDMLPGERRLDGDAGLDYSRRLYLLTNGADKIFLLQKNGHYCCSPFSRNQFVAAIQTMGMGNLIECFQTNKEGKRVLLPSSEILHRHSTAIHQFFAVPQLEGGVLEHPDTERSALKVVCYRRNPRLKPAYCKEVDEWLQLLAGNEWERFSRWLSMAPAFEDGPMAALSLLSHPGTGKDLLANGLKETLEVPALAGAEDISSTFNSGLASSPYLHINEGWPSGRNANKAPADIFREMVGGTTISINRKFQPPMDLKAHPRLLFTANNEGIISRLLDGKNLSREDREAIEQRLIHIHACKEAAEYLQHLGGYDYTAREGAKWVGGTDENKDFILARHLLYMYENRDPRPEGRFLVMGRPSDELFRLMLLRNRNATLVYQALVEMAESGIEDRVGFGWSKGRLFTTTSELCNYINGPMRKEFGVSVEQKDVVEVLKVLVVKEWKIDLRPDKGRGVMLWSELCVETLCRASMVLGLPMKKLAAAYQKQREDGLIKGEDLFKSEE